MKRRHTGWAALPVAAAIGVACGASNHDVGFADGGGGSSGGTGDGGGSSGSSGDGAPSDSRGSSGSESGSFGNLDATTTPDAFVGCATTTQMATQLPLDLYFMMDTSGSMDELVAAGQSKWQAISSAMTAFVGDPASAGIGIGMQYFPVPMAGVPASCTSSAQCNGAGPCLLGICYLAAVAGTIVPCDATTPCKRPDTCIAVGECQNDPNTLCDPTNPQCGNDTNGFPLGACQMVTSSYCVAGDSCTTTDYATPAVPIQPLPGVSGAITTSLAARHPQGGTPTSAALQGAISEAQTFANANPTHTVAVVLATDGIPDECTPNTVAGVAQIAASGVSGTPSIKTFVIGTFTPNDATSGAAAVNQIAASGGTSQAFVISTTSQNVEQQFVAALNSIRGSSLPCDYALPQPDGGMPDFGKLNVQYTSGAGASTTIPYVESAAQCDPTKGGWYYDADPAEGGVPTKILLCSASCGTIKGDSQGRIDVVLGCKTVTIAQ
jgi:hypothetical protein